MSSASHDAERVGRCVLVGVAADKAYLSRVGVPFLAVNHLGGHLAAKCTNRPRCKSA